MSIRSIKTYSELIDLKTFEERYEYLRLGRAIGAESFGFDRIFNQMFYRSREWKEIRNKIITRDRGCDLAHPDYEIYGERIYIHHINPISMDDLKNHTEYLLNPNFLIVTTHATHNAIHYGDKTLLTLDPIIRTPNDTCPWKKQRKED